MPHALPVEPNAPDYRPADGRPFRLTLGLRALDLRDWIEVDAHRADELALKAALLASRHAEVVACRTAGEEPSRELFALVADHLLGRFPGLVAREGRAIRDRQTGWLVDPAALHPVDAAGRLVQEDLCLMVRQPEGWVLEAASVCAPSRWTLAEKMGRTLLDVHEPVPGYAEAIGRPTDAMFDKFTPERPVWRVNWTLLDRPELFQPAPEGRKRGGAGVTAANAGRALTFRVERQTMRVLPRTGAVLFGIRTYVRPLAELAADPQTAAHLAASLRGTAPAFAAYKGWLSVQEAALAYLDTRAQPGAAGAPGAQ
jgi:hypothetical protein